MEPYIVSDGQVISVVLDLSLRHLNGQRVVDGVKQQLIEYVRQSLEGEDLLYLYHPLLFEPVETIGPIVSSIGNYETDGWLFDLSTALTRTFYIMSAEDMDYTKTMLLITDRIQDAVSLDKLFRLEERDQTDCRFVLVGVGNQYRREVLMEQTKRPHERTCRCVRYIHVDDPSSLCETLLRSCNEKELHCPTG